MRQDLRIWLEFFETFNSLSVFQDRYWSLNADINLFTDNAAGLGLPGCQNQICDSLSRPQLRRFRRLDPNAEPMPDKVPDHLWNVFNLEPSVL